MIIEIKSLGDVVAIVTGSSVLLSTFAYGHWKLFAAPIINRVLAPIVDNTAVSQRLLRKKFPDEYTKIEGDVISERAMRGLA